MRVRDFRGIIILVLLAGGCSSAGEEATPEERSGTEVRTPYQENDSASSPSQSITRKLGLVLPSSAANVMWHPEYGAFVYIGYARFDIPSGELQKFLADNPRLPPYGELKVNDGLLNSVSHLGGCPEWWKPQDLASPVCASRTGTREREKRGIWRWTFDVCIGKVGPDGSQCVYILFAEEPTPKST
jgi:hypothetical protein